MESLLVTAGKSTKDAADDPAHALWKVPLAATLRRAGVLYTWIRETLHLGPVTKIRAQVFRFNERRVPHPVEKTARFGWRYRAYEHELFPATEVARDMT